MTTPTAPGSLGIDDQLEWFDKMAPAALDQVIEWMQEHRDVVLRRARLRLETIGCADYGDTSWHADRTQLQFEWLNEAADQVVYGVMHTRRVFLGLD
jgi:hypothetical protein